MLQLPGQQDVQTLNCSFAPHPAVKCLAMQHMSTALSLPRLTSLSCSKLHLKHLRVWTRAGLPGLQEI